MRAMVIREFGDPDVFEERTVDDPTPGPGELLVRVQATSVNPVDTKLRKSGSWAGITPPAVLGSDVAGVVEGVGNGVTGFSAGDEVFYTAELGGSGSYAELHVSSASIVWRKPRTMSFEDAAALPLVGCTAWDALVERARVVPGERVLIHGIGGVGSVAAQIAKSAGAWVAVTCGRYDFDLARGLGADLAIDYRDDDFTEVLADTPVDVVFNTVGGNLLERSAPIIRPWGRMALIATGSDNLDMVYRKNVTVHLVMMTRAQYKMERLANLVEWNHLKAVVDSVMPLDRVADAHRKVEAGKVKGKIVLSV